MNFSADWFAVGTQWTALAVWLLLLVLALPKAWPVLKQHAHAVGIAAVLLALWWSLRAAPKNDHLSGMAYHLLGVALAALMLGIPAAFCLASAVMLPYTWLWQGVAGMPVMGLNVLATIVPPLLVSALAQAVSRRLPRNVFVYIFINGFLAGALGIFLTAAAVGFCLYAAGVFPAELLWQSALPVFFFIAWGEAFLTGLLTAIFIALAPQWLHTFADREYLSQPVPQIWK